MECHGEDNTLPTRLYLALELNPAALTAVMGRAPSPGTAPVIGRFPIEDGPPLWAVPSLAPPIGIFPVGGGLRP